MIYNVISIEDGFVTLEDHNKSLTRIPLSEISGEVREGYYVDFNGTVFSILSDETMRRKREMFEKQKKLTSNQ